MKKKIYFIINPISGDVQKSNLPSLIDQNLDSSIYDSEIFYTERIGHASHLAQEAIEKGADVVVAVGGDGSINEVASALVYTSVVLGIIPLGSGNALAYHLELPVKKIAKAIQVLNQGKIIAIDTLRTNKGEVICFAGIGMEAVAARTYRHLGKRGFLAYSWSAILSIFFKYKPAKVTFYLDGVKYVENIFMFTIYNARFMGYKVGKVEQVSLIDGLMHVVVIKKFSMWKLLWIAILEFIGKMYLAKETQIYEVKNLKIDLPKKAHIQMDGDSFITSSDFELEINPLSLNIIVPQNLENY